MERERGFVISPFTAATAVAAAGVEAEFGRRGNNASSSSSGRWKGALAFDFNKYAPYLAISRETSRAPRWLRRLVRPATSGKGLVGGGPCARGGDLDGEDGEDAFGSGSGGGAARIAVHLSPADHVAMLTLEFGNGGAGGGRNGSGLDRVAVGGGSALSSLAASTARPSPAPLKAFVRARTDGRGFSGGQGLRGVLSGLSGGVIFNHTVEI